MGKWRSKFAGSIIDSHVHFMGPITDADNLLTVRDAYGADKIGFVSIQDERTGMGLPQSLYMKAKYPGQFYVFAGLNHAAELSEGNVSTPSLADQVDEFVSIGCDGVKMIEGKPTSRQKMDIPVDAPYFADYWARVEELELPITWHVNDPEEFWAPELLPQWAQEKGWGYGPDDVQKEQLYTEVDNVLARYPKLNIIFAHFYFLSADLPRFARFLDANPTVGFDLTPGIEMLYNTSRDVDEARDFFIKYADRIFFGTDVFSSLTALEAIGRAGIVYRWLESEDTFRVPPTVDMLLGKPEDGVIKGMALPDEVLKKIYGGNYTRLAGETPKALDVDGAIALCTRAGAIAQGMSGVKAEDSGPVEIARMLEQLWS